MSGGKLYPWVDEEYPVSIITMSPAREYFTQRIAHGKVFKSEEATR